MRCSEVLGLVLPAEGAVFAVSQTNNVLSGLACVNQLFAPAKVLILSEILERKQLIFCSASQTMNGSSGNSCPPLFPARPLLRQESNPSVYWRRKRTQQLLLLLVVFNLKAWGNNPFIYIIFFTNFSAVCSLHFSVHFMDLSWMTPT